MSEKKINIKEMINRRKARGMILLEQGFEPKQLDHKTWVIPSQNGNGTYTVKYHLQPNRHWTCTCPDFEFRGVPCKHIHAVKVWSNLKDKFEQIGLKIKQNIKISEELEVSCCKFCHSTDFTKYGKKNAKISIELYDFIIQTLNKYGMLFQEQPRGYSNVNMEAIE